MTLFLEKRGKPFWGITGVILVILLGVVDYLTGFELAFSLFYLFPISLVAWYAGGRSGLVISAISAVAWFLADYSNGNFYSNRTIYVWNTIIRLGFFITTTWLLSALRRSNIKNRELARTDYVTGAASIRYFYVLAEAEINRADRYKHPFTLAYIDLDNFKTVNDRLGHSAGDKVLQTVTRCIKRQVRSVDIIARLGGDEFALLLPETGNGEAHAALTRVHQNLLDEMQQNGWPVTFSIGVVTYKVRPKSVDDMVKMADDTMYMVKANGKNKLGYTIYEG